eukprot:549277_1
MTSDGFVPIRDLVAMSKYKQNGIKEKHIGDIDKHTFSIKRINGIWHIGAKTGHSIPIKVNYNQFQKITRNMSKKIGTVCYSAVPNNWTHIINTGIKGDSKSTIEFIPSNRCENSILPGKEWKFQLLVHMNLEAYVRDNLPCYLSDNKIIIPGFNGFINKKYFVKVTTFKDGKIGNVVWENPERCESAYKREKKNAMTALHDYLDKIKREISCIYSAYLTKCPLGKTYHGQNMAIVYCTIGDITIMKRRYNYNYKLKQLQQMCAKDILEELNAWDESTMYMNI